MNRKNKRIRKVITILLILLLLIAIALSISIFSQYKNDVMYDEAIDSQQELKQEILAALEIEKAKKLAPQLEDNKSENNNSEEEEAVLPSNAGNYGGANSAASSSSLSAGVWLTIDDTAIDYPVMQYSNNDYYINHDANGNTNKNGAIFLDYRNNYDFSDYNNILYGHNMKSGRMFQNLVKFKDETYFENHRTGTLYTQDKTYKLTIFAVALTEPTSEYYNYIFTSPSDFEEHISMVKTTAMFYRDGVTVTSTDNILCLSTCSYEFTDARTVVLAKLD